MAPDFICGTGGAFHASPRKLDEVKDDVTRILMRYRPKIQELVANACQRPLIRFWTPQPGSNTPADMNFREHIETLAIPNIQDVPNLLLHDLFTERTAMDRERIEKVFSGIGHKCVNNRNFSRLTDPNAIESLSTLLALAKLA